MSASDTSYQTIAKGLVTQTEPVLSKLTQYPLLFYYYRTSKPERATAENWAAVSHNDILGYYYSFAKMCLREKDLVEYQSFCLLMARWYWNGTIESPFPEVKPVTIEMSLNERLTGTEMMLKLAGAERDIGPVSGVAKLWFALVLLKKIEIGECATEMQAQTSIKKAQKLIEQAVVNLSKCDINNNDFLFAHCKILDPENKQLCKDEATLIATLRAVKKFIIDALAIAKSMDESFKKSIPQSPSLLQQLSDFGHQLLYAYNVSATTNQQTASAARSHAHSSPQQGTGLRA